MPLDLPAARPAAAPAWALELGRRARHLCALKVVGVSVWIGLFFVGYFYLLQHPPRPPIVMPLTALDPLIPVQPPALRVGQVRGPMGGPRWLRALNLGWFAAIAWSTLAPRQHVAIDVLAGAALGLVFVLPSLRCRPAAATERRAGVAADATQLMNPM